MNVNPVTELMDLNKVASTFPKPPAHAIRRENMITTVFEMLGNESEMVIVEGPDGIGKTTLLAQLASQYPNNTFSLFVRSSSRWAYDSNMLTRDLCDQIGWVLNKEGYRTKKELDPIQLLGQRIYELQRHSNYERETYYFVVDGLNEIPDEDANEREMILKLLPFGIPRFRFILSGPIAVLKDRIQRLGGTSPFRMVGFTFDETREFFDGIDVDRPALETFHKACKFIPGNLASVRRLLQSGTPVAELLAELPERVPDLLDIEWRIVEKDDGILRQALAILAFDRRLHTLASLSRLCKTSESELGNVLERCTFVERRGEEIEFICEGFKRLAAKRLVKMKREVLETAISDLLIASDSPDALTYLPGFLHQAGRYVELLNYLSPQHIGGLIDCSQSWIPLHQKADLGVDTALRLERDGDLLRFGLQRATISTMESCEPWRSEMEAYVALDDFAAAQALVMRMITIEDRLHLLAVIARAKKTKGLPIEPELKDQIHQLYKELDRPSLGRRGVEIASDLVFTQPELAIELVQDSIGTNGPVDRQDLALARVSISALMSADEGNDELKSTHQALRAKVKNPAIQKFMDTVSVFFGGYTAEAVIAEVDKWEKVSDRVFTLGSWAVTNSDNPDAGLVVEYALSTILKTTTYSANAKVFRELASPLLSIPDLAKVQALISRLDGLKGTIQAAGPTIEFALLQATLSQAEARYDLQATSDRLEDLFFFIDALGEPSSKLASLAVLAHALKKVDPEKTFEKRSGIHSAVVEGLKSVVAEILTRSADHYGAVRPAIEALASSDLRAALDLLAKLNTLPRRDAAFVKFINAVAGFRPSEADFNAILEAYGKIKSITERARATLEALEAWLRHKDIIAPFISKDFRILGWIKDIPDAEDRCQAICMLGEILGNEESIPQSFFSTLWEELDRTWNSVDSGWSKIDVGFKIVANLAVGFREISRQYFEKTEKARREIILDCRGTALTYLGCVRLALRSFGGLLKRKVYHESDLEALNELIDRIPARGARVGAWTEVALKFAFAHDISRCQEIAATKIRPVLESDSITDLQTRWDYTILAAPALYKAHQTSAKRIIDKLPQPFRDNAYRQISSFIITKRLPTETYDAAGTPQTRPSYEDCLDVFTVILCLEADHAVYGQIELLVDSVAKRFRDEYNKVQIADMLQQLRGIAQSKFPNAAYIAHEGFKILAEAQIGRLEKGTGIWDGLAARARAIPNVADSALVLMGIGSAMPSNKVPAAVKLMREAKEIIPTIATFEDRCGRYEFLAKLSSERDKALSKECVRNAWSETNPSDPREFQQARERIIDFAHRLDPEFAAGLASESDGDPGRELARSEAKKRLGLLKLRERVASEENDAIKPTHDVQQQVEISRMMLAGLNSNRIHPVHREFTRQFIKQASQMNADEAYVVFSWVIENAVRRYSDSNEAHSVLRPLFDAARMSSELAYKIAERIRSVTDSTISAARHSDSSSETLIKPGDREKALSLLQQWAASAVGFIKITDPYFGLQDLDLVKLIRGANATIPIFILTSRKLQRDAGLQIPWDESFQSHWRINLSDLDPGEVRIVIVGKGSAGGHPIHDRWWLAENGGLRIGTSTNSLGISKISEVSSIEAGDIAAKLAEVDRYLNTSVRGDEGERYTYLPFWL